MQNALFTPVNREVVSPLLRTEWFIEWYIVKVALPKGGELCAEKGNRKPFAFTFFSGKEC